MSKGNLLDYLRLGSKENIDAVVLMYIATQIASGKCILFVFFTDFIVDHIYHLKGSA